VVNHYNDLLWQKLTEQNIPQWLNVLNDTLMKSANLHHQHQNKLNATDQIVTEAKWGAENQC